jgi:hypothetical protein
MRLINIFTVKDNEKVIFRIYAIYKRRIYGYSFNGKDL